MFDQNKNDGSVAKITDNVSSKKNILEDNLQNISIRTMKGDLKTAKESGAIVLSSAKETTSSENTDSAPGNNQENNISKKPLEPQTSTSVAPQPEKKLENTPPEGLLNFDNKLTPASPTLPPKPDLAANVNASVVTPPAPSPNPMPNLTSGSTVDHKSDKLAQNVVASPSPPQKNLAEIPSNIPLPSKNDAKKGNLSKILITIGAIVALGAISFGIYFSMPFIKSIFRKDPKNPAPVVKKPVEPPVVDPIIITNEFKLLDFPNVYDFNISDDEADFYASNYDNLKLILKDKINLNEIVIPNDDFLDIQISKNGDFPDSEKIIYDISPAFPPTILNKLGAKFNLFAYIADSEPRLGLVLEIASKEDLALLMRQWEETIGEDLEELFVNGIIAEDTSNSFADANYNNVDIRYKNLGLKDSAIDYAIVDNLLIITTSKDSMLDMIDLLRVVDSVENYEEEQEDIYEGWETYENEEYGFGIIHPKEWYIYENNLGDDMSIDFTPLNSDEYSPDIKWPVLSVSVIGESYFGSDNPTPQELANHMIEEIKEAFPNSSLVPINNSLGVLDGLLGEIAIVTENGSTKGIGETFFSKQDSKYIFLIFMYAPEDEILYKEKFENMFETFEFIE